jgi:hypothetical protein
MLLPRPREKAELQKLKGATPKERDGVKSKRRSDALDIAFNNPFDTLKRLEDCWSVYWSSRGTRDALSVCPRLIS